VQVSSSAVNTCIRIIHIQTTATHFNTLQHSATHCNTLRNIFYLQTHASVLYTYKRLHTNIIAYVQTLTATHCNTLQHILLFFNLSKRVVKTYIGIMHVCMHTHAYHDTLQHVQGLLIVQHAQGLLYSTNGAVCRSVLQCVVALCSVL